jgi:hypothetical protein
MGEETWMTVSVGARQARGGFADPAVPGLGIAPLGRYAGPALPGRDRHPVID